MKTTILTNISKIPLEVELFRNYDAPEVRTSNKISLVGGSVSKFEGDIGYLIPLDRKKDLRIDTYE